MALNENITVLMAERILHTKASEEYVAVRFEYPEQDVSKEVWVPVVYRRTGLDIKPGDVDRLNEHLNTVYEQMNPNRYKGWLIRQEEYWSRKKKATTTKGIFDVLKDGKWHCCDCELNNPNFARRVQDLKEFGYTIATRLNCDCPICAKSKRTMIMLLPIERVELAGNGYETWSPKLRKRIMNVLDNFDTYECVKSSHLLPDHKFSEIRWDDDTKAENPDDMTDEEIRAKFQLLTNQRNQQKREACRECFQTGKRGVVYGIVYFYEGGELWDEKIPKKGKGAEEGCLGCPWYDLASWREHLMVDLVKNKE